MILLFLGDFRSTVIATLTIPLAVLAAIAALLATGNTVNAMTLGGLALAVGPLVDNAIVVVENTHRHQSMGKSPQQAAADGAGEVAQPALVATLSTILVLVPLAFMPGMGKFLFKPLALAVAFAMLASLVLALTFVPSRCAAWLKPHGQAHDDNGDSRVGWFRRLHRRVDRGLGRLTARYEGALRLALANRAVVLLAVGGLFLFSLSLLPRIGREFFPQVDAGQLTIYVRAPTGSKIEKTNEYLDRFETFVRDVIPERDRKMIVSEVGTTTNWSAAYTPNSGPQDAVVKVQLTDDRSRTSQEYASLLRQRFDELRRTDRHFAALRVSFDTGGMVSAALNYGAPSPIEIQVTGGSRSEAFALARQIRDRAAAVPGAADVRILQREDYPQMVIEIDRQKAQQMGFDVPEVFQTVATAMNSSVMVDRNFWLDPGNGNQYWLAVQYEEKTDRKLDEVRDISLTSRRTGELVKLGSLVHFRRQESAPAEMTHDNLANVVSVMVNTDGRDLGGVASEIRKRIADLEAAAPRGVVVRMSGEFERMNEAFGNLGAGLGLAAVLVY